MISKDIARRVLTVGVQHLPPTGGVSQVIYSYYKYIFPVFNYICTTLVRTPKWRKLLCLFQAIAKCMWKLGTDRQLSIVHIHTAAHVSFRRKAIFVRIARLFGRKVVMHIHAGAFIDYYHEEPDFVKRMLLKCDVLIVLSQLHVPFYRDTVGHKNIVVINNIIAEPHLTGEPRSATGPLHLLFMGDIKDEKGVFDMVECFDEHRDEFDGKVVLHICGRGQDDRLRAMIERHDLSSMVVFEGWIENERKDQLLNQCHINILPSYIEGLPISILEAMSYGMPIISTTIGGIPSVVEQDVNGRLFTPGDKAAMAVAIKHYIDNRQAVAQQGECSSRLSKQYYPDAVVTSLEALYKTML